MEEWRDIIGYEGLYQVSSLGNVKSCERRVKCTNNTSTRLVREKILKQNFNKGGYMVVSLYKDCEKKLFTVHRLVARAFVQNPENFYEINHINDIRTDNRVENLEWCSRSYNDSWKRRKNRKTLKLDTCKIKKILLNKKVNAEMTGKIAKALGVDVLDIIETKN